MSVRYPSGAVGQAGQMAGFGGPPRTTVISYESGPAPADPGPPQRPRMRLIKWKPLVRNTLRGFADVRLPNGLIVREIPVHETHGRRWAALPSKPQIDRDGQLRRVDGKIAYTPVLEWDSRELREGWYDRVVALVRQAHPDDLDGGSV